MRAVSPRDAKRAELGDVVVVIRRERPPSRRGRKLLELLVDLLDKPDEEAR